HRDIGVAHRQTREIRKGQDLGTELSADLWYLIMRQPKQLVIDAEFRHQLERRRMNGVAAEVAEKIPMLLDDHNRDTGAREEIAKHQTCGAAADDAAGGRERLASHAVASSAIMAAVPPIRWPAWRSSAA